MIVEEAEQRDQSRADLLTPPRVSFIGRDDDRRYPFDRVVERREETVLAIDEQFIERAPRDTRAGHDMRDGDVRGATLGYNLDHRRQDPTPLDLRNLPDPRSMDIRIRTPMPDRTPVHVGVPVPVRVLAR